MPRSRALLSLVVLSATGCDVVYRLHRDDPDARLDDSVPADQSIDQMVSTEWNQPQLLFDAVEDDDPTLTGDLLEIYFNRNDDIYWAKRTSATLPFPTPVRNGELSSLQLDTSPKISRDGLTIYFASERTGTAGQEDVMMATRPSRTASWSNITRLTQLNTMYNDSAASPTTDMLELVMHSKRMGGSLYSLYRSTRGSTSAVWATPAPITELNTPPESSNPMLSEDGLTIYFDSNRDDATVQSELYVAHRANKSSMFGTATPIAILNSTRDDRDPWISPDDSMIVFSSERGGALGIYFSTRIPP